MEFAISNNEPEERLSSLIQPQVSLFPTTVRDSSSQTKNSPGIRTVVTEGSYRELVSVVTEGSLGSYDLFYCC